MEESQPFEIELFFKLMPSRNEIIFINSLVLAQQIYFFLHNEKL